MTIFEAALFNEEPRCRLFLELQEVCASNSRGCVGGDSRPKFVHFATLFLIGSSVLYNSRSIKEARSVPVVSEEMEIELSPVSE
jgi:hypothetical protein